MRALLDVNVLIALIDEDHVFHEKAHVWWESNRDKGFATCPLTENGAVRIMARPNYSSVTQFSISELTGKLCDFAKNNDHQFWIDEISFTDENVFALDKIHGHRQITDIYLLALATTNSGRLVTFDRAIPLSTVRNAKAENLFTI